MKNNGKVNEMQLFHGTSKNDPRIIYESEFGFDVRMSKGGKWEWAIYFSEDASYCDRFAYHTTDSCKEILLAQVLIGCTYVSPPNRHLRLPPAKESQETCTGHWHFDSVTGISRNSVARMVYDNEKTYPSHIIKYKK